MNRRGRPVTVERLDGLEGLGSLAAELKAVGVTLDYPQVLDEQAGCGAFKNDPKRNPSLDAGVLPDAEKRAESPGDQRQGQRSDHQAARPWSHVRNPAANDVKG